MPPQRPPAGRSPGPPASTITHANRQVSDPPGRPVSKGGRGKSNAFAPPSSGEPGLGSKLVTELIGTALLTFTIAVAAGQGGSMAPLAIGTTLMCAVYAGGHVSGANYNPAVTLAIWVRGELGFFAAIAYMIAQLIGGFAGGAGAMVLEPAWMGTAGTDTGSSQWWPATAADVGIGYPAKGAGVTDTQAFLAEVVFTFALCHTVLHVATSPVQAGNSYYGLAIGFTVFAGAVAVGGVSGGAFNPAVAMLSFVRLTYSEALSQGVSAEVAVALDTLKTATWLHMSAPMAGGFLAGLLFRITHPSQVGDGTGVLKSLRESLAPYIIELVGTMLLAFTVATAAAPSNPSSLAPLAIGSILMSQVYAGGATSGAHYNPAVTVAVSLRRALAAWETKLLVPPLVGLCYIIVQCAGAVGGGVLASLVVPAIGFPAAAPGVTTNLALTAEGIATFFLCFVVLQTATVAKMANKEYFGIAIGFTVASMAYTIGPLSGGALNPAVALLGRVASNAPFALTTTPWIYFAGPIGGGVVAAIIFRCVSADSFNVGSMV